MLLIFNDQWIITKVWLAGGGGGEGCGGGGGGLFSLTRLF